MDYRRLKLISWQSGYDIRDTPNRQYRVIEARRIRKQEKAALARKVAIETMQPEATESG